MKPNAHWHFHVSTFILIPYMLICHKHCLSQTLLASDMFNSYMI